MPDEVLAIVEVAALLEAAAETVCAVARAGEMPGFRTRQGRIDLGRWIDAQPRSGDGGHGGE